MSPISPVEELPLTATTEAFGGAPEAHAGRKRSRFYLSTPDWLLRVLVESSFIVLSILLALAVDEWREDRQHVQLAQQALLIFEREIQQNLSMLADLEPYHSGLRSVVSEFAADGSHVVELRSIMEGLQPAVLRNTAWQTALATGSLTHIDVTTVSGLSLTYSVQERFREETRASLPHFTGHTDLTREEAAQHVVEAQAYLTRLVQMEQQLKAYYQQALEMIKQSPVYVRPSGPPPDSSRLSSS